MVLTTQSPFGGSDETKTKDTGRIVEELIEDNWNVSGILASDVKWGWRGDMILQSGKSITLRCYPYFSNTLKLTLNGSRTEIIDSIMIDVYVINNNLTNNDIGRDPKAVKIAKFLNDLFIINQGSHYKGLYDFMSQGAEIQGDITNKNITHVMKRIQTRYVLDVVNV